MNTASPDIHIFDRQLRRKRRCPEDNSFLARQSAAQLLDRLKDIKRDFPRALLIGKADPSLERAENIDSIICMSLKGGGDLCADEEYLPFAEGSFDLVLSNLNLHAVNDLPGALIQIRRALKPDGVFLAAMYGGETLYELRQSLIHAETAVKGGMSPRVFPFADKPQMGALLQRAGFALPVIDSDVLTVTYKDIFALMHDLRRLGETNIIKKRSLRNPGKAFFAEAARYYQERFSDKNGQIMASFELIYMIGWAPHESQQKPLRPGSARKRLSDALDTDEIKTGEKARP